MDRIAIGIGALVALVQTFLFFVLSGIREQMKQDRDAAALRCTQIESAAMARISESAQAAAARTSEVERRLADAREHMVPREEFRSEFAAFFARQDAREEQARTQRDEMLRQLSETTAQVRLVVQRAEFMEKQAEAMVEEVAEITNVAVSLNARLGQMSPPLPPLPLPR
jgi:hypothetical protein